MPVHMLEDEAELLTTDMIGKTEKVADDMIKESHIIKLGLPENESIEEYEKFWDDLTEQFFRDWDEEDRIMKRIKELEEEIELSKLQGCNYEIANWLLPELQRHKDMLK